MQNTEQLAAWVIACLPDHAVLSAPLLLSPIIGDAGFRRYYRSNTSPALMAVHAPPEHEDTLAFVRKDVALKAAGVRVPGVYAVEYQQGFMLQEDLGRDLLLPRLNSDTMSKLYEAAELELVKIQLVPPEIEIFPPYDEQQLHREMALFPEWFAANLLGLNLSAGDESLLRQAFDFLASAALEQPQVVVHRDFHARNLLLSPTCEIGVIDFQDALIGAFTYDLVSLLKDCYIRWPTAVIRKRALHFLRRRVDDMGVDPVDDQQLLRWFDLMGLQRHIKVLGIFARLWLRDGKSQYLNDLPLVLRYTLEVTAAYSELNSFNDWLNERVLPVLPNQPWYRDWRTAGE